LVRAGGVFSHRPGFFDLVHLIGKLLDLYGVVPLQRLPMHSGWPPTDPRFLLLFCADRIVACAYRGEKPGISSGGESATADVLARLR